MRVIAVFFVVFTHTGNDGFFSFVNYPSSSILYWLCMFISIFTKFAVPLFLAISGALILSKPAEQNNKWVKKIWRMVVVLIGISLGYYFYYRHYNYISIIDFFKRLYTQPVPPHLWFLYLYLAFLISIPFLRVLIHHMQNWHFYYMFAIAIFFNGFLPVTEYIFAPNSCTLCPSLKNSLSWIGSSTVIYPCLGYFLQHKLKYDSIKKIAPYLWIVNIALIWLSCGMTHYRSLATGELSEASSQYFYNSFVLLNCAAIFLTIRYMFERKMVPQCVCHVTLSIGSCTFGIYLFHMVFMGRLVYIPFTTYLKSLEINSMICSMIACIAVFGASYFMTLLCSRLPLLKKFIRP